MGIGHASRETRLITLSTCTALQAVKIHFASFVQLKVEKKIAPFVQLNAKLHIQEKCPLLLTHTDTQLTAKFNRKKFIANY